MADGQGTASPWEPITDKQKLKVLGKLLEECGELISATARCIIQGIDEKHPETGEVNRTWLEKEIADVLSKIHCAILYLKLDNKTIAAREEKKTRFHLPGFGKHDA